MRLRTWEYTVTHQHGRSGRYTINENLTGATLGDQRPCRISFRTAMWIVHGWNQVGGLMKYHLVIPIIKG